MTLPIVSLLAVVALAGAVDFDSGQAMPAGWASGVTGHGSARWRVVKDSSASSAPNVLEQSGEGTFCWAVDQRASIRDGWVEAAIKPERGREDQAGGLVFRFIDAGNYYVVRINALEDNVVLFKTVNGKRIPLQLKGRMIGYGMDVAVPDAQWSRLRVEFRGTLFKVFYNGKPMFSVEDRTFTGAGAVGVWTKADSVTRFDDIRYAAVPE
jgi:hypothetical protein